MRTVFFIAVTILTVVFSPLSGTAWAQIAAPRLNPVNIDSMLVTPNRLNQPFNPAVLPWSGQSRVAVARTDLAAESTFAGVTQSANTGEGTMLQGRNVGELISIAAESYQVVLKDLSTGDESDVDGLLVAVALRIGDLFSVGVSQQTSEFVDPTNTDTETLPRLGATVRIGEAFFIGVTTGDETLENTNAGVTTEADRTVIQFGVAYLARDGENGLHLGYYRQTVDAIDDPDFGTEDEKESAAFTVELIFSNILLGYESLDTETVDATGTTQNEVGVTTISIGWAPAKGLSIVASLKEEETTNVPSGFIF